MAAEIRFPIWFFFTILQSMGWPRTKGILRKTQYIDAAAMDTVLDQLRSIGRTVGAGDEVLGERLIADFARDLDRGWDDRLSELDELLTDALENVAAVYYSGYVSEVPWDQIGAGERHNVATVFACEVWSGLKHPAAVRDAADRERVSSRDRARRAVQHGLAVEPNELPESFDELLADCVATIRDFEADQGALDDPPPTLIEYVRSIREPEG